MPRTVSRDRRLAPEEEHRIERAFAGEKLEGKEAARRSPDDAHLRVLFQFIVETGCRLREAYRTRIEHFATSRAASSTCKAPRAAPAPSKPRGSCR